MKVEAWIFGATTTFFVIATPIYWFSTSATLPNGGDWTGTVALTCALLLTLMVTLYLGFHARRMDNRRPEDNREAEIADGAGELGFFPPYSWWPLWSGAALAVCVYGIAIGAWWMFVIGAGLGMIAVSGLVFEYYRGEHAH